MIMIVKSPGYYSFFTAISANATADALLSAATMLFCTISFKATADAFIG